ncbi:hypothetical protein [Dokdonella sp.]|uniref:hypothetical protein n=1 Tax=Dokdonella sp. TaxID=2291710 RepID=UPI002F40FAB8
MAGIAFALAHGLATASDEPLPDADSPSGDMTPRDVRQAQRDVYDALVASASPRQRVLVGRLYLGDDETPSALRPKREDVVAQAARSAPQDAFVQWIAADTGRYTGSQCGPTHWPVAEVANLVRLEPGNAGALQYAVALAQAKGDAVALDEALARMASASRADDHLGDEIAEWRNAYVAHPAAADPGVSLWDEAPVAERALLGALQEAAYRTTPTKFALAKACTPDGDSERTWQRIGWCVDAGTLLAGKGSSFALREAGLKMLTAAGATPADLADLQRQHDWLAANAANPMRNADAFRDAPADVVSDWRNAKSEIAATTHRLARLGKPATPPAGWDAKRQEAEHAAEEASSEQTWAAYSRELLAGMEADGDVRMRALALAAAPMRAMLDAAASNKGAEVGAAATDATTALADFAAAHPDDVFVQWVAAGEGDERARRNLQRLEPDNAAAWALSIDDAATDRTQTLQRMASSTRYALHLKEAGEIWSAAAKKYPPPADLDLGRMTESSDAPPTPLSDDDRAAMIAATFAFTSAVQGVGSFSTISKACTVKSDTCTAIGRILADRSDTLIGTRLGFALLRKQGAMSAADIATARRLDWWQEGMRGLSTTREVIAYLRDSIAHGESEAMRLAMQRKGKLEPPADWQSPSEKQAAAKR